MQNERNTDLLRISEIAKKADVLPSTIRYYTDLGLIEVAGYTEGGHRLYKEQETLSKVRQIKWLEQKGYSIEQIKAELSKSTGKKKILVIDDEPEVGQLIIDLLKDKINAEIEVVYDGFNAGRALDNTLPDLVILDLLLPGVNGFEICKQIRQDKFLNGTKILAITGYDTPEHKKQIFAAGADDYLAKPMDTKLLFEKIQNLLRQG